MHRCGKKIFIQHLAIEKIQFNYSQAIENNDTYYSILNVTNIREVVLGVKAVADITWDFSSFEAQGWLENYCHEQYGAEVKKCVAQVYNSLYASYPKLDNKRISGSLLFIDGMARMAGLNLIKLISGITIVQDLAPRWPVFELCDLKTYAERFYEISKNGLIEFKAAYSTSTEVLAKIPDNRKDYYITNVIVQLEIIIGLYSWLNYLAQIPTETEALKKKALVYEAIFAMEKLLVDRTKAEQGKWKNWYVGETKFNLIQVLEDTKGLLSIV